MKKLFTILTTGMLMLALSGCYGYDDDEYQNGDLVPEVPTSDLTLGYSVTLSNNELRMSHTFCQENVTVLMFAGDLGLDGYGTFVSSGDVVIERFPSGNDIALTTSKGSLTVGSAISVDYTGESEIAPMTITSIEKVPC